MFFAPDFLQEGMDYEMKRVLCYGDSNTYGYDPNTQGRYPKDVRWPGVLAGLLGEEYEVIEEGLNNRTTALEPEGEPWRSGAYYLEPCLRSHIPVDLFVLMLGSNDMKTVFCQTAESVGTHVRQLIREIRRVSAEKNPWGQSCEILLISPIFVSERIIEVDDSNEFGGMAAVNLSRQLPSVYERIAGEEGCIYLNGASCADPSREDGLHLDEDGHRKLAEALAQVIKNIYSDIQR